MFESLQDPEKKPIEVRATEALGQGFDLASDFRLKFVKRCPHGCRLVHFDEQRKRDVVLPGGATVPGVPESIRVDKGDHIRFKSDVLQFNQMSELLNQKSSIQGKVPSGYLNAIFDLSGAWLNDAADAKYLAFDGYFISLYYLHLTASPLVLHDHVKSSVPRHWDPAALSRFIQTYGTHIIVGMAVGGQDLLCVKQRPSSPIPPAELKGYLEELGDCLFSDANSPILERMAKDNKKKVPEVFNRMLQAHTMQFTSITETSSKDGLTLIWSKRGGDVFAQSHSRWLQTMAANPEAVLFKFVPITSLLNGIPGSGYLSHAINLYLRYKPTLEDLPYFLEFQVPSHWAPLFCELPLRHQRKKTSFPSLQFSFLGPKMYVSSSQVTSDQKPVIGLRLYLEGKKSNRLAIHVQHLSSLPSIMSFTSGNQTTHKPQWRGSDDYESSNQFLEAVRWKGYAKVCASLVKHDPSWLLQGENSNGVFVVTGAQLIVKGKWPRKVLHLRLLFAHIPNCTIRKTEWAAAPDSSRKSSFLTNLSTTFSFTQRAVADASKQQQQLPATLNSGVYPDGPPVPVRSTKLLKYVDASEVARGPYDSPGHWLVTAAKLVTEGGRIGLHVKFALLDYLQQPE
ncbi:MACPF domain-containing protein At4g24290-like [Andrographis paniculata]|uniref:MACPF domain-containing protein At4g24290-like n=1 Tax=Andrographis paniculata TaxID=175694 RepID=UPI0021E92EA6|nr:MACPF domain-containing protein At4g24290-like [Andrographis paniculata]XP_051133399.1 MACPF domain-containing protein At4g24290-like [Andrographis paniculata]